MGRSSPFSIASSTVAGCLRLAPRVAGNGKKFFVDGGAGRGGGEVDAGDLAGKNFGLGVWGLLRGGGDANGTAEVRFAARCEGKGDALNGDVGGDFDEGDGFIAALGEVGGLGDGSIEGLGFAVGWDSNALDHGGGGKEG